MLVRHLWVSMSLMSVSVSHQLGSLLKGTKPDSFFGVSPFPFTPGFFLGLFLDIFGLIQKGFTILELKPKWFIHFPYFMREMVLPQMVFAILNI